jgi:hypothetical protein
MRVLEFTPWKDKRMRTNRILFPAAMLALCLCVFAPGARGQRWYNEERDQKAREAARIAEEITNKSSFEAQLRNLDKFAERDFEVYFTGAERQMELDLHTIRTWGSVLKIVNDTKATLKSSTFLTANDVNTIVADLEKDCPRTTPLGISVCDAKAALQTLKDAHTKADKANKELDEELTSRLENIDAIDDIVNQTKAFLTSDQAKKKTVKELSATFAGLAKSFLTFNVRLQQINNDAQDDLKLLLQRIAVETLQLEVDHWKTLSEINIRRSAEESDLNYLAGDVEERVAQIAKCFGVSPEDLAKQEIRATLTATVTTQSCLIVDPETPGQFKTLSKDQIATNIYQMLHNVTALVARGKTPFKLAEKREAHELHRFSIRKSLVVARGYELVLRTGTDRLSRYYAGGLKPQQIAQLVYSAATLAIPGVIAGN